MIYQLNEMRKKTIRSHKMEIGPWNGLVLFQTVCLSESNSCLIVERKRQSHMRYLVTDSLISSRKRISRSDRTNMLTPAGYISSSFKKL